ncbi:MAG: GNAT family N-acetyltransferase [Glaciecola sp.]
MNALFKRTESKYWFAYNARIYLRKLVLDDAPFIQVLTNEPGWLEYIGDRNIHNVHDAERFLKQGPLRTYKTHGFGMYIIMDRFTHEPIGLCGLLQRSYLDAPDLGFAVSKVHWRNGYAYDAAELVLSNIHTLTKSDRVYASAKHQNTKSQSLLKKLGFRLLDEPLKIPSEPETFALFCKSV